VIRGIIALFASGIILNPMVLFGIIGGCYIMTTMDSAEIHNLFTNAHFYAGIFLFTGFYTCIFKRTYFAGGRRIDWNTTLAGIFGQFALAVISLVFSCLFFFTLSFGDLDTASQEQANISLASE
jgi:hypothetical protein